MPTAALTVYNCEYVAPTHPRSRLDGDTFRCRGNVKPVIPDSQLWVPKVRVVRIDAPAENKFGAEEARTALVDWLTRKPFNLLCYARDKYGRLLADAEAGEGLLSQHMLDSGFVTPMRLQTAKDLLPDSDENLVRAVAYPAID